MGSIRIVMKWMVDGRANTRITGSMSVMPIYRQLPCLPPIPPELDSRGRLSLRGPWRLQTKVGRAPYHKVMRKLAAVEEARAVMTEGMEWGVWKWLLEKRGVQEIADRATAALHEADRKVKAAWSDELKTAYKELVEQEKPKRGRRQEKDPEGVDIAPEVRLMAKKVKQAYDEGQRARGDAEDTILDIS